MIEFKSIASGSGGNCYTVDDGITKIMIEAGINIKQIKQALDFKVSSLAALLVSHSHGDHSKSIKDVANLGVDCYMSAATKEEVGIDHNRVKIMESKKQFRIGTFVILPFSLNHDVETLGFLIQSDNGKRLLFMSDTVYCRYTFNNLNYIAMEINYSESIINANVESGRIDKGLKRRIVGSHMSLENALEFLEANDLSQIEEIHLLHLSNANSDEALFKSEVQKKTGSLVFVH